MHCAEWAQGQGLRLLCRPWCSRSANPPLLASPLQIFNSRQTSCIGCYSDGTSITPWTWRALVAVFPNCAVYTAQESLGCPQEVTCTLISCWRPWSRSPRTSKILTCLYLVYEYSPHLRRPCEHLTSTLLSAISTEKPWRTAQSLLSIHTRASSADAWAWCIARPLRSRQAHCLIPLMTCRGFADLVFYVEACESGSIFEGLLDNELNIYATTASNAYESSWGTYCPGISQVICNNIHMKLAGNPNLNVFHPMFPNDVTAGCSFCKYKRQAWLSYVNDGNNNDWPTSWRLQFATRKQWDRSVRTWGLLCKYNTWYFCRHEPWPTSGVHDMPGWPVQHCLPGELVSSLWLALSRHLLAQDNKHSVISIYASVFQSAGMLCTGAECMPRLLTAMRHTGTFAWLWCACLHVWLPAQPQECHDSIALSLSSIALQWQVLPCSDIKDLTKETLEKQYELVKQRTSNNGTYNQGSHVMQFGDLVIDEEPAADYLGSLNTGKPFQLSMQGSVEPIKRATFPI